MADEQPHERYVPPLEGPDHGYIGRVPDPTPNEAYTVTGVTGATAHVDDTPKSVKTAQKPAAEKPATK